jgi:hypothetical protein
VTELSSVSAGPEEEPDPARILSQGSNESE